MMSPSLRTYHAGKRSSIQCYLLLAFLFFNIHSAFAASPVTYYEYDPNGNLTKLTDGLNHSTVMEYDRLNRMRRSIRPDTGQIRYNYNAIDQMVQVIDPRNLVTQYHFDGLANLKQQTSPDSGVTAKTYDQAGNVLTSLDARGQTTVYSYDALNRLTQSSYADGQVTQYIYDQGTYAQGRLTGIRHQFPAGHAFAGTLIISFIYDHHGRVLSESRTLPSGNSATISYVYDSAGRLSNIVYPSGRVVIYQYDVKGQIAAVQTAESNGAMQITIASNIQYRPFGASQSHVWGNNTTYTRTFDQDDRIVRYPFNNSNIQLTYDSASNITSKVDVNNSGYNQSYAYDALDRLEQQIEYSTVRNWSYDATGNRISQTLGANTTVYQYGSTSNRLVQIGNQPVVTDLNGSIVSDPDNSYTYDARGRLISTANSAGTTYYLIDPLGRRLAKKNTSPLQLTTITQFIYDTAGHLLAELDANGGMFQEHIWADNVPLAVAVAPLGGTILNNSIANDAISIFYVQVDQLGTPRALIDSQGTVIWNWTGEAFGNSAANEDVDGNGIKVGYYLRFPGQYLDTETDLNYNYFRDYNSATGRYIQSDQIGLKGGLNTYAYVENAPLKYVDPKGLLKWTGTYDLKSGGIGKLGGTRGTFELISECDIDGNQGFVEVIGYSGSLGVGVPMSQTRGSVTFQDGSIRTHPQGFNGRFTVDSLGLQVGPIGFGTTTIYLGDALSTNIDGKGFDGGVQFGIYGSATVINSDIRTCLCKK
jgi:RHS repeat-associated protein